jgi:integrase
MKRFDTQHLGLLSLEGDYSTGAARLAMRYALKMVEGGAASQIQLGASTSWRHVRIILLWLSSLPDGRDWDDLTSEDLRASAEEFDKGISNVHRRYLFRCALSTFGTFFPEAKAIRLKSVDVNESASSYVFSEPQFHEACLQMRRRLTRFRATPLEIDATEHVMRFGFRFGLRAGCCYYLEVRDLHIAGNEVEVVLRRALKTDNGRRKIPAHALMTPSELDDLRAWHAERLRTDGPKGRLFPLKAPSNDVSRRISLALKVATGQDVVDRHHFRHSFATWLNVRLTELANPEAKIRDFFPVDVVPPRLSPDAWPSLFGGREPGPTKRILSVLQSFLGHASTDTSACHYIHGLDQLWSDAMHRRLESLGLGTRKMLVEACKLPRSTAYRLLETGNLDGLFTAVWGLPASNYLGDSTPTSKMLNSLIALNNAISCVRAEKASVNHAARLFSVSEPALIKAMSAVQIVLPFDCGTLEDRRDLAALVKEYEMLPEESRATTIDALSVFLQHRQSRGDIAAFFDSNEIEDAVRVVACFRLLGIEFACVRYFPSYSARNSAARSRPNLRSLPTWARRDEFRGIGVERRQLPVGRACGPEGWFGLRPISRNSAARGSCRVLARFAVLLPLAISELNESDGGGSS